jgi:hypothetical protein
MRTREIEALLDVAHHKAAELAAQEIRHHLRPFNLKRHPLGYSNIPTLGHDSNCLTLGDVPYWYWTYAHPACQAVREAGEYASRLPAEVQHRLKEHL